MTIHKEGYKILLVVLLILVIINLPGFILFEPGNLLQKILFTPSIIVFLLCLYFFRHPIRTIQTDEKIIYAPADGSVVVIEETEETEYLKDRRIQVSIFMSAFDVHVNRYPVGGIVKYVNHKQGKNFIARHPKSSTENERTTIVIDTGRNIEIVIRQIAGIIARRIVTYARVDDKIKQGDQLGFIKFGSRVDLFLPVSSKIKIDLHQTVVANKTAIAEL